MHRLDPLVQAALRAACRWGPNVLLTVRGRKSGVPRTVPVAIVREGDAEYLFSPFGEVAWVHNLRAAGTAEIGRGRRRRTVDAREITPAEAAPHLEAALRSMLRVPGLGSMIAGWYGITEGVNARGLRGGRAVATRPSSSASAPEREPPVRPP